MSKTAADLELVPSYDAPTEKRLAVHKKNIRLFADGVRRSGAQLFGYAYLAGREINLAAEVLPKGQLEPWITQHFPDIGRSTAYNWRDFAKAIEAKSPTVGLLEDGKPLLSANGKKPINKKQQEAILKIVPEVMDGKGMMEFVRAAKFIKEKQKPKHNPPKDLSPDEKLAAETEQAEAQVGGVIADIALLLEDDGSVLTKVSPKTRKALLDQAIELNNKLRSLQSATKH